MTEEFEVKIGRVSLEGFSTAELVVELSERDGVKSYTAGDGDIADIRITYPYGGTGNEETNGPAKILVVREPAVSLNYRVV